MIVPLTIYLLERLVRLVLSHVRNTELIDVTLKGGKASKVRRPDWRHQFAAWGISNTSGLDELKEQLYDHTLC